MSRNEAVLKFLLRVKWLDGYGLRLYAAKVESSPCMCVCTISETANSGVYCCVKPRVARETQANVVNEH